MPIVRIELFPGRTAQTKASLAREITKVFQDVAGVPGTAITVMFFEVAPSDWVVAGEPHANPSPEK